MIVANLEKYSKIDHHLECFKEKDGLFAGELAMLTLKTKTAS